MPTVKYKPSADCAYTQLISKIRGVPILTEADVERTNTPSPDPQTLAAQLMDASIGNARPIPSNTDVEVKKISTGLMLAQYYNSDSESDEDDNASENSNNNSILASSKSVKTDKCVDDVIDDKPLPPGILCPPEDQRVIIDKTAAYVLKNGKEFEEILRTKSDQRFTFLQYTDPYHKYYTYKVTGAICPNVADVKPTHRNETITDAAIGIKERIERKKMENRAPKPKS